MRKKRGNYNTTYIIFRDNYTCQDCKKLLKIKDIIIHHIDENPMNNLRKNLVSLCRRCHSKRHGFLGARNKERAFTIVELKSMGLTFQQIGDKLHITRQRAHKIFKEYTRS